MIFNFLIKFSGEKKKTKLAVHVLCWMRMDVNVDMLINTLHRVC